ncbi:MAG: class I SAM-dependent methyltransferase [Desulfobacterales bacterium]|jgi:SAM-dependent methyltransferase
MSHKKWTEYYERQKGQLICPEGFIVRIFLSTFPYPLLSDRNFHGRKILDLSCGYGRNLGLLIDLGFSVFATEVSDEIIQKTHEYFPEVEISKGSNTNLPFRNGFFDYLMACNTCYYLEGDSVFANNLCEISRVLKEEGIFIGSIPTLNHFIFSGGDHCADGSVIIRQDRLGLRNGDRLQGAANSNHVSQMLSPFFKNIQIGHMKDECFGMARDLYYFTCNCR